jgi:fermentation-respiration switch protein FrsA (DUF1100 family)
MRLLQFLFWLLASLFVAYLAIALLMYFMQSSLVYHPQKKITTTPDAVGLPYKDVTFTADDGVQLNGWYVPADSANLTVCYFHGNAGNISGRIQTLQLLNNLGLNVLMFDYRGYGKSGGTPTEEGTYRDAEAAWEYLRNGRGVAESDIIIMGRSLGGSIAAWLAARKPTGAAVIESTFTSAVDLGVELYPWLPVRWMMTIEYNTLANIRDINAPLFMAHSRDDRVVPYHHGETLFEAAREPKTFVELRGSHGSGFWETGVKYRDGLQKFLESYVSKSAEIQE